jgi:hypothetical protein
VLAASLQVPVVLDRLALRVDDRLDFEEAVRREEGEPDRPIGRALLVKIIPMVPAFGWVSVITS